MQPDQSKREPNAYVLAFSLLTWVVATISSVPAWLRELRAHRCDPVWMRAVSLWLVPILWAAGGGGSHALLECAWWTLLVILIAQDVRARRAIRDGRLTNTRFIGRPLVARVFPNLGQGSAHFLEIVMWLGLAVLAAAFEEPGWALVFAIWAGTLPWELVFLTRRDQTQEFDSLDAVDMQRQHAERVRERIGRD